MSERPHKSYGGLLLTGGRSRRMGNDKALLEVNGRTRLQHAIDVLAPIAAPLYIISDDAAHADSRADRIADRSPDSGPLGGILTGLEALSENSKSEWAAVLAVDMPGISVAFFREMYAEVVKRSEADLVCMTDPYSAQPLAAFWNISAITLLKKCLQSGDLSLMKALHHLNIDYWAGNANFDPSDQYIFRNLNRPEEFAAWKKEMEDQGTHEH